MEPGGLASTVDSIWYLHQENVRRTLVKLTRDADLADDLAQETYLRARAGFAHCRGENDLAWLRSIARNVCYSHMRRAWVHAETPFDEEVDGAGILDAGSGSHLSKLHLNGALSALPAPLRTALELRYSEGRSYSEIAAASKTCLRTAKSRVTCAVKMLRCAFEDDRNDMQPSCAEHTAHRLIDYLYGLLPPGRHSTTQSHLSECGHCSAVLRAIQAFVHRLEASPGVGKMMHVVDLQNDCAPSLDVLSMSVNQSDSPLDGLQFYSTIGYRLHSVALPGKPLYHQARPSRRWPDRLKYSARLPYLVVPGQFSRMRCFYDFIADRSARQIEKGTYRFEWSQMPNNDLDTVYTQAFRLPEGAELLDCHPAPVAASDPSMIAWHAHLAPAERFRSRVQYRLA